MQRFLWSAACCLLPAAFCLFDGAAAARTITFEGDYGLVRQQPEAAEVYDATGATVNVEQGTNNACWNIRPKDLPESAVFIGGRCIGVGKNRTWARKPLYDQGNGAGIRAEIRDFTIRHFYSEYAWDPIKPAAGGDRWTIEDTWIRSGRDDCIEADHQPDRITVRRSMIVDCHSVISVTPGGGSPLKGPVLLEFIDSVLSHACMLDEGAACLKRDTRTGYPWARKYRGNMDPGYTGGTGGRSVSQFFKVKGCGEVITIRFKGNHVAAGASIAGPGPDGELYTADDVWQENGFHTPARNLDFFQCMTVTPDSTDNTFYWLGGCDFEGFEMVTLHGACVPKVFNLDPQIWTAASNSKAAWLATHHRWVAEVWQGEAPEPRE